MRRVSAGLAALLVLFSLGACSAVGPVSESIQDRVEDIARPYGFSIPGWEINAFASELREPDIPRSYYGLKPEELVVRYFTLAAEANALKSNPSAPLVRAQAVDEEMRSLADAVTDVLEKQITDELLANNITSPFPIVDRIPVVFPAVLFKLEAPPKLLIISPRDRIELEQRITLDPALSEEDRRAIESRCDALGVSSLVEELGGIATYPAFVLNDASLRFTLDAATEEWLHGYMAFTPAGARYVLDTAGLLNDVDIHTINETAVGMVSKEIGQRIYSSRYAPVLPPARPPPATPAPFDFNREMRVTRQNVDAYLASGDVVGAEGYMEARRLVFLRNGYFIRRLNQAYFAFHGTYGYDPASSSPIYGDLQALRARSSSLKTFLDTVAGLSSYRDLQEAVAISGGVGGGNAPAAKLAAPAANLRPQAFP